MEYQASSGILSKKLSNGHSFAGGSVYDGVFASPSSKFGAGVTPNFSPLVEDYREIFGGSEASRGSSIPFLDVPELNEGKISVDVRSSQLDYSKIFGDFGDSSFAVGFEELSAEPNKRKKSDEARTQAERSSPSEAAESFSWTPGNGVSSQEASHQALNGVKKFNMSYNKVSNGNANGTSGTNGTTHSAQLNAVRGYACVIDEVTPLRRAEGDRPVFKVVNDDCPETNIHDWLMEGDHFKRTTVDVRAGEIDKQTSRGGVFQNNSNWFKSNSMSNSFEKHEVGHGTRPSKLPTSSSLPSNFNLGNNEDSTNVDSPPYFDEEVDNNSVAATSAAALRKAIEEAQARIKMAKELMERKKVGLQNGGKLSFGDGVKTDERKECNVAYMVNRSKMKTTPKVCKIGIPLKVFSGARQQNTAGPCQGTTDFEVREKVPSSTEFDGETPWKKISGQVDHGWEEAEVFEVEQFYEVENTGEHWSPTTEVDFPLHVSGVTGKQNMTCSGHVTKNYDVREFVSGTKEADKETPWKELRSSEVDYGEEKAEQFYEVDNTDKNWATILEFEEIKTMQSSDKNEWKEKKIVEQAQEQSQHCGDSPKPAEEEDNSEQVETGVGIPNGIEGESDRWKDCVRSLVDEEVSDHEKKEKEHQVAVKQEESEEIVQSSKENDKDEENQNEFQEAIEDDKMLETRGLEDIKPMERQSKAWACVENEKKGEEVCKQEKHEKEQSDAHEVDDNENRFISNSTTKEEIIKETLDKLHLGKKIAKILSHDDELDENGKFEEVGGKKEMLIGDVSHKEENENSQEETCQWVQSGRTETKIDLGARDEDKMTAASGEPNNLGATNNMCKQDEIGNLSRHQKSILHTEHDETVEVSEQLQACKEGGSLSQAILENSESRNELDSVKEKSNMEEREVEEADDFPQGLELTKIMRPTDDTTEDFLYKHDTDDIGIINMNFVQNPNDQPDRQLEIVNDSREHVEELACEMEEVEENINESEVDVNLEDDKNSTECFDEQGWVEENINESEVDVNLEDDKNSTECFDEQGWVEDGVNMKRAQSSDSCERKGENVELDRETEINPSTEKDHKYHKKTSVSQSAEGNEKSCQESWPRQNAETKENDQATVTVEESLTGNSLPKEVELEKEHLRKIDEAREREREKERIAVERAIREVRERAFAEARERAAAGRAAAGSRQRATAEVRERIGKTSVEHSDKSAAEKASKEAKLKAERAAVERATAEARERALEKAMSGKAASEARKQNSQYNGPSSSSTSRYPNSSNHAVSNSTERDDGANGESAQRCKARSERHQRITERAEKALAEKNRRDLLAQKEQAERNRLAETLDIEVKRWSSGKERNLRALLSTLQYILGPDSGWQAIPLTDIITTTAVKKAYRKATLFVHPDKLQQRGANIQQKYICEKVFDLLKEACNKFNVEER